MGMMMRDLTTIRDFISYDPETGVFRWIKSPNGRAPLGSECGATLRTSGLEYRYIGFGGKMYLGHRLAWWWMHGVMPPRNKDVDHANRNPLDNRIGNLRLASRSQNSANMGSRKRDATRFRGVTNLAHNPKFWDARICKDRVKHYLGIYRSPEEAARAYDTAAKRLFGEFANLNFK